MKKIFFSVLASAFLAGCSPQPSQQSAVDAQEVQVQDRDFSGSWFSAPVTQIYAPDFDYHIRSSERFVRNNGLVRVRNYMEIRGVSQEQAAQVLEEKFVSEGYEKRGGDWKDGVYEAEYRKRGAATVYVLIRDIAEGQVYDTIDATGIVRVSWNFRPPTSTN